MADQPPRGRRLPEGQRTLPIGTTVDMTERQPKVTPPRGNDSIDVRSTAPMKTTTPILDEPTRTMMPGDKAKFIDPSDPRLRTSVHASRAPGASTSTIRDVPVPKSVVAARDRLLPDARDRAQAQEHVTDERPAAQQPAASVAVEIALGAGTPVQHEKTKIWVATHKPPVDPDTRLILLREPDSPRAASFRVLRHRLQQQGDPRVIAVTSAESGEGKTTCAVNLAMALGECGRARVLLVEANLRAPSLAALFGFLPPSCFATQLAQHKERPLEPWSVVEAFSPSLHVIAVKPGQEPRPLLDGPAFAIALEMLRHAEYDYVVLDTPPVLGSADVNLIEDSADGVLLTGWARRTSGRALRRAVDQLAPSKILGVTLLDV